MGEAKKAKRNGFKNLCIIKIAQMIYKDRCENVTIENKNSTIN